MAAPGLALYYGGLVRKKNVLSTMMQCIFLMGMMTVVWALVGYSLAFGGHRAIIGNFEFAFMRGVGRVWDAQTSQPLTPMFDSHLPVSRTCSSNACSLSFLRPSWPGPLQNA